MITSTNTASARDVQRNYRKVIEKVKKTNKPVVVISRNQPEVAIVSLDVLEEYERLKKETVDWSFVDEIRALNADKDPDKVYKDVKEEVETIRQEMYEKRQKDKSSR